jgi:pyridoxal phosphate enzyme (YggS family)
MAFNNAVYQEIKGKLGDQVTLVAVSKTKPIADILSAYAAGVRDFGENYVQELRDKQPVLPGDIRWHFIGHLQSNKVKYMASYVYLIQSVDSAGLLEEINKQALKNGRVIHVLLQVHVAKEETKFGWDVNELQEWLRLGIWSNYHGVSIMGVMGMASFVDDSAQVSEEFEEVKACFDQLNRTVFKDNPLTQLSMGMSGDWPLAVEKGSNVIRVGSALFGSRN